MNVLKSVCKTPGVLPVIRQVGLWKAPIYKNSVGFMNIVAAGTRNYSSTTDDSETQAKNAGLVLGKWYNELGSMMYIQRVNAKGNFVGFYQTAVGRVPQGEKFPLVGKMSFDDSNPTLGFTVVWKESTTSWVGQYFPADHKRKELLMTTWILRDFKTAPTLEEDWESTLINRDVFARKPITINFN